MEDASKPIVSIIIPTKNSFKFLYKCLESVKAQSYKKTEIIVVDNYSSDKTLEIAKKYTRNIYSAGDERSAQRNFGATLASGKYILFIDSDMVLSERVIEDCVKEIERESSRVGIIIPEESFGKGFWAKCKQLEKSFYLGIDWIEAARFFRKKDFEKVRGYNETFISGEDWDLSQRIQNLGKIARISPHIYHNEGELSLREDLKKKFYYASTFTRYMENKSNSGNITKQINVIDRYKLFFSKPKLLIKNPIVSLGMLYMKTLEFIFGGLGIYLFK